MAFKRLIGLIFAGVLALSPALADIVVRIAPPHMRVEKRGPRPSPNHVWVSGYHRWSHQRGGWVLVEGHWR